MAEFILKDWYGKEKSFDHETIYVRDAEGNLLPFTHGTGASPDIRYVTFMSYDGLIEYGKKAVAVGDDCADPIARGVFAKPTRESDEYNYYFYGWANTPNGSADSDWYKEVTENKTVYASYFMLANIAKGECGAKCFWKLEGDYVLTISGEGDMDDVTDGNQPWYEHQGNIRSVVIEYGVTNIGNNAFRKCSNLASITIPESVSGIGGNAFLSCSSLTSIDIPDSVTSIGVNVLQACSSLASVKLSAGLLSISNSAFDQCKALTSITVPDSVTSIGNSAFSSCSALTSIKLGENVASIGTYAFMGCKLLASVTIPASVTSIATYAFWSCEKMASVTFKDTTTWYVTNTQGATSGTTLSSSNLANASTAATYLKSTYMSYYWYKN